MPTNAELAAGLLRNAANFFRGVGERNPVVREQMDANAETYERVAELVEKEPTAEMPNPS